MCNSCLYIPLSAQVGLRCLGIGEISRYKIRIREFIIPTTRRANKTQLLTDRTCLVIGYIGVNTKCSFSRPESDGTPLSEIFAQRESSLILFDPRRAWKIHENPFARSVQH